MARLTLGNKERSIRALSLGHTRSQCLCGRGAHNWTDFEIVEMDALSRTPFVSVLDLIHFLSKQLEVL